MEMVRRWKHLLTLGVHVISPETGWMWVRHSIGSWEREVVYACALMWKSILSRRVELVVSHKRTAVRLCDKIGAPLHLPWRYFLLLQPNTCMNQRDNPGGWSDKGHGWPCLVNYPLVLQTTESTLIQASYKCMWRVMGQVALLVFGSCLCRSCYVDSWKGWCRTQLW